MEREREIIRDLLIIINFEKILSH